MNVGLGFSCIISTFENTKVTLVLGMSLICDLLSVTTLPKVIISILYNTTILSITCLHVEYVDRKLISTGLDISLSQTTVSVLGKSN